VPTTIFDSPATYLATCAVIALAQAVYVLFGFGSGLIAVGGLALLFPDVRDVVVVLLLVNVPAELFVVLRSRSAIEWRGVLRLGIGIAIGIPIGTAVLRLGEPRVLLTVLGAALVAVGAAFVRLPHRTRTEPPRWAAPPVGLLSGVLTGLFGTGGPPLIVWYHLAGRDKAAFRGNLMALFLLMTLVRVPSYLAGGLITAPRILSGAAVLPAVVAGAWAGHRAHVEIAERTFRRAVAIGLLAIGILLLVRTVR